MQIEKADFDQFALIMKEEQKRLIIWGIGTFFKTCIVRLIKEYGLEKQVDVLIDGDEKKQRERIILAGREFAVQSPEIMREKTDNYVLFITSSYFAGIINWADSIEACRHMRCFIAPLMFREQKENDYSRYKCQSRQIPKVIHYCWFGKKELPEKNKKCIESWRRYCPDYEIKEWNEDNYDLKKNRYMYQAYQAGRYGYVPDYARIDILYQYGGIYFDTDVKLLGNIDDLLYLRGFTSFEEYPMVNFGGGSGSVKGLEILKRILDYREETDFIDENGALNLLTCGFYETSPLIEAGLKIRNSVQNVEGLTILTSDYFHVKSTVTKEIHIKEKTLGIHDFDWSWVTEEQKEEQKRTSRFVNQYFT